MNHTPNTIQKPKFKKHLVRERNSDAKIVIIIPVR